MTLIEKIKHSVEKATKLTCVYQSAEDVNRIVDNIEMPCAVFFLLTSGQVADDLRNIRERVTVAMFFVDLTEFDFQAIENEHIIDRCKKSAGKWLASLVSSHDLRLVSVEGTERVYDRFDAQLTGYAVRVTVEELQGVCSK